jgi:hypothetical protein
MNKGDHDLFEQELHKLKPAELPENLMRRLVSARREILVAELRLKPQRGTDWRLVLRWLIPAAATAVIAFVLIWSSVRSKSGLPVASVADSAGPVLKADDVEIDRQLIASFDAVARMPNGEPVRFRCREWTDGVVLRDTGQGIVFEQTAPRLEIVPVSFETY